jgi:siroheme decarboxylase
MTIDTIDRRIIAATQGGLPLTPAPFAEVANWLGLTEAAVLERMDALQASGVIRRVALAPNHYALGLVANGMSVWDVEDAVAVELGERVGALEFVSHCYLRPRRDGWPYNLFAMVHGRSRDEVEVLRGRIAELLGPACHGRDILYSTRILKKTGLRLTEGGQ